MVGMAGTVGIFGMVGIVGMVLGRDKDRFMYEDYELPIAVKR